jgi:nitroreductase
MNAVIEAIDKRRSVRAYEVKPVPRDLVNAVIAAGNEAPSAMIQERAQVPQAVAG